MLGWLSRQVLQVQQLDVAADDAEPPHFSISRLNSLA